jgi:hypothetical protein
MNISEEIEYSVERSRTLWYGDFGEGMLVTKFFEIFIKF